MFCAFDCGSYRVMFIIGYSVSEQSVTKWLYVTAANAFHNYYIFIIKKKHLMLEIPRLRLSNKLGFGRLRLFGFN